MSVLLRKFVSLVLTEAAISPNVISERELAVFLRPSRARNGFSMTLWNPRAVQERLDTMVRLPEVRWEEMLDDLEANYKDWTVGFIEMSKEKSDTTGPAWGAWAVTAAAAEKGYGPFLYDLAMSYCKTIMSDRYTVSKFAEKVWNKYATRSDIIAKPLDNVKNPQTPPPEDDAKVYQDRPALNYAYSTSHPLDVSKFVDKTQVEVMKITNSIAEKLRGQKKSAEMARDLYNTIYAAADDYFDMRYKSAT